MPGSDETITGRRYTIVPRRQVTIDDIGKAAPPRVRILPPEPGRLPVPDRAPAPDRIRNRPTPAESEG